MSDDKIVPHTLLITVDNEPGALARVIGLFSGRGYNIESLTVAEVDRASRTSAITLVTSGTLAVIDQIQAQLGRLVPVHKVEDIGHEVPGIERELALVDVAASGANREAAEKLAQDNGAQIIDSNTKSLLLELSGTSARINAFLEQIRPLGAIKVSRTGVAAIVRYP